MNSFETGPIFVPRVGQNLWRNRGLVLVYAFWRNPSWRMRSDMNPKLTKFSEKCSVVTYSSIFWALPGAHAPGRVHSRSLQFHLNMTRRACRSKSNSLVGEIRGKLQQIFWIPNDLFGKDFSKSVNSIDLGAIFP